MPKFIYVLVPRSSTTYLPMILVIIILNTSSATDINSSKELIGFTRSTNAITPDGSTSNILQQNGLKYSWFLYSAGESLIPTLSIATLATKAVLSKKL